MQKKILIIDDSQLVIDWVVTVLSPTYEVISLNSGQGAGALVVREKPAMVLVDMRMPVLNGEDVVSIIRKSRVGKTVPIVFLSGAPRQEIEAAVAASGADGYIAKTGDVPAFLASVEDYVERRVTTPGRKAVRGEGAQPSTPLTEPVPGRRLVLVADTGSTLDLCPLLARNDILVRRVSGAQQFLALIRSAAPTMIIVGPDLRDAAATELIANVRADAAVRNLSILFIENGGSLMRANRARSAGANVSLVAPYSEADLVLAIAKLVNVAPRRAARLMVRSEVRCGDKRGFWVGSTRNLSATGLLLEGKEALAIGDCVGLNFFLPSRVAEVKVTAEVVRIHERSAGSMVVGVRFREISDEDAKAIDMFVRGSSRATGPKEPGPG
jgi:DNA-binding response OmpR family regulator